MMPVLLLLQVPGSPATAAPAAEAGRSVRAVRTSSPPRIDGRLDEPVWRRAARITRFVQRSPSEGAEPEQRSELLLLYTKSTLFVGLRLHDTQPGRVRRGLGRRDNPPDSDLVTVYLDPTLSRERGTFFQINASGVLADGLIYSENLLDSSWDGVWRGMARLERWGWTAELEIPLRTIAYQDTEVQAWGLYVERYVQRTKELSGWPAVPKSGNAFVSRFGRLQELRGLRRAATLRLLPFVAAELQLERPDGSSRPDDLLRPNGGLDLRYSFSEGISVSATFNPDFGQVEEDPAVVNLSPNEVFWGERRPFFVEGAALFRTPLVLLHTRRIGARPSAPSASRGGAIVEVDPEARIVEAVKLVGDGRHHSYGLLSALVLPSSARERLADGRVVDRAADQGGHYAAGRLLLNTARWARLGLMLTALGRLEQGELDDACVWGGDWDLRWGEGWQAKGQMSGAAAASGAGYGLWFQGGQLGAPRWRAWVEAESFSRHYEINDVGYQWRNDMVRLRGYAQRRLPSRWRLLRDMALTLWGQVGFNHTDPELQFDRRIELDTWFAFTNLWELWTGVGRRFFTLDDRETRGGLPYGRPAEVYLWLGGTSDTSHRLRATGTAIFSLEASAPSVSLDCTVTLDLWDRLNLSLHARYLLQQKLRRWIETASVSGQQRAVFGELDHDELEIRIGGLLGLTRSLTLQVFGQILHSVGEYGDRYLELVPLYDGQTVLVRTSYDADADFSRLSLLLHTILRLDLGGGAAAYLVYKLAGDLQRDGRPVSFDLEGALSALADQGQLQLLLLKVSYGWDL